MVVRAEEIASILKQQIEGFDAEAVEASVGTVIVAGDGIAEIHGLGECMSSELKLLRWQIDPNREPLLDSLDQYIDGMRRPLSS